MSTNPNANPQVTEILEKSSSWKEERMLLREIVLECDVVEELKWYQPAYTYNGKTFIIIGKFKDCCTISFFKGALIEDKFNLLELPGENTRAARVIKFKSLDEIKAAKDKLKDYIHQAMQIEKSGKKYDFRAGDDELILPEEWNTVTAQNPGLDKAFKDLTPGRQRGYLLHFKSAKQSATRLSRMEKCIDKIMSGKGYNE